MVVDHFLVFISFFEKIMAKVTNIYSKFSPEERSRILRKTSIRLNLFCDLENQILKYRLLSWFLCFLSSVNIWLGALLIWKLWG